jgi:hypothetical protein
MEYEGAIYHVMSRGNRRANIFRVEADRERFLGPLAEACGKTQWEVHAYGLMRNRFDDAGLDRGPVTDGELDVCIQLAE